MSVVLTEVCLSVSSTLSKLYHYYLPKYSEGEHPVSAKFRGLRNRFIRWWVLGAPHEQPIFTSVFEKNVIFAGANRVSATFQLRFSYVSAHLKFFIFERSFFLSQNIRVPQSQTFGRTFVFCVSAAFQLAKTGCSPSEYFVAGAEPEQGYRSGGASVGVS